MTRTEQITLVRRAGRYIVLAEELNHTSFATLCIGVPLTLVAFSGFSVWPGVIFWMLSWASYSLSRYYSSAARGLQDAVNKARETAPPEPPQDR